MRSARFSSTTSGRITFRGIRRSRRVVSEFLITSHLARKNRHGFKERARRVLGESCPPSYATGSVVLLASIGGVFAFKMESSWKLALWNTIGSSVLVHNWMLANDFVNYLARGRAPIATQRFWMLSVEAQFYVA